MRSINSTDFVDNFDLTEMTVGVVGFGFVGKAVENFFNSQCRVLAYDKHDKSLANDALEDVVRESHVIFVCVPTPMKKTGECHTGIVEEVMADIERVAGAVQRDTQEFIVVMKSTVPPGFTRKMQLRHRDVRLVFSPEFLTEKNSIQDFENSNRMIFGGSERDATVLFKFFEPRLASKAAILQMDPTPAELVKLFTNALLMTKVLFANEMYQVCQELGVDYNEVKTVACLDRRLGASHLAVPGHDGSLGAGGHCFPKDINNLRHVARELGVNEKLFTAVIERNDELRADKDWLEMKGRAVIDE